MDMTVNASYLIWFEKRTKLLIKSQSKSLNHSRSYSVHLFHLIDNGAQTPAGYDTDAVKWIEWTTYWWCPLNRRGKNLWHLFHEEKEMKKGNEMVSPPNRAPVFVVGSALILFSWQNWSIRAVSLSFGLKGWRKTPVFREHKEARMTWLTRGWRAQVLTQGSLCRRTHSILFNSFPLSPWHLTLLSSFPGISPILLQVDHMLIFFFFFPKRHS